MSIQTNPGIEMTRSDEPLIFKPGQMVSDIPGMADLEIGVSKLFV